MNKLFNDLLAKIDENWIAETLMKMIGIRSENPFNEPLQPGLGEKQMAEFLMDKMKGFGMEVEMVEPVKDRPNVYGFLHGTDGGFTLMLGGHTDTVRTNGYHDAYDVKLENGKIFGRGACDMKAAFAGYLTVAKILSESGIRLKGNLIICGNMDEEFQMIGSRFIGENGPAADQGIIGEPTNLLICPANKGRVSTKIITRGTAAHSSVPEKGNNAIIQMSKIIGSFEDYNDELKNRPPHHLCGHGRFTPGVIQGGVQVNMVPDYCELEVDRRTLPGETKDVVYRELHSRIATVKTADMIYEISEPTWLINPNEISSNEPVVKALRKAHLTITGEDPGINAFAAGSDAPYMGFPTVVCGPGSIDQAHTTNEFVELKEVVSAAKIYLHVVLDLLS